MDINYELYKVFYYVAVSLSFSEASKKLYISQSAVSQSIKVLEKKLDQTLFIRSTKKVQLTPEGEILLRHIEPAVNLIRRGETQIMETNTLGGGQIRIQELNGFPMEAACLMDTLLVVNKDSPGVLANIAITLNVAGYNIANLRLARTKRAGEVITVIESDARVDEATIKNLMGVQDVLRVISMPKF